MGLLFGQTGAPALRIKRLRPGACLPAYQTSQASGLDLAACLEAPVTIEPGEIRVIPCGFAMSLPPGWEAQVRPRSGLASRHGVTLPNAPGTIDADYRGEVMAALINLGRVAFVVEHGMRIAQMVIAQVAMARVHETSDLDGPMESETGGQSRNVELRPFPPKTDEVVATGVIPGAGAGAGMRARGEGGFGSTGL